MKSKKGSKHGSKYKKQRFKVYSKGLRILHLCHIDISKYAKFQYLAQQ